MSDDSAEQSREQKLAEIRARVEALRAARTGGAAPTAPAPSSAEPAAPPAESQAAPPAAPPAEGTAPEGSGGDASREDKLAAVKARADALRAARGGGAAPAAAAGTPAAAKVAAARPAATALEVPVSSINPGGRPGTAPQSTALEVSGTINNSVEIRAASTEDDNIRKLLGGLGAYQNPVRGNAWQVDYRYYAEARRRLEAAGYKVTEQDYLGRPLKGWSPTTRGWTRVQS